MSDSCSAGTSVDTSGPRLLELVKQSYSSVYRTEHVTIPDDLETIKVSLDQSIGSRFVSEISNLVLSSEHFNLLQ